MQNYLYIGEEENPSFLFKVLHDGTHHLAKFAGQEGIKLKKERYTPTVYDLVFDGIYFESCKAGLKKKKQFVYIKTRMLSIYPDFDGDIDIYLEESIQRKINNLHSRKRRFFRKAYLNKWNYSVTISFDSKKHTEETFKAGLKKCLSNFHTRRGWRYMGMFERAPETNRLHFHALFYIPDGELVGDFYEKRDYSLKNKCMQTVHMNTFFESRFGRNDFEPIDRHEVIKGKSIEYIIKYISKSDAGIFYSRAIPDYLLVYLNNNDFSVKMNEFFAKYVMYDDILHDNTIEELYEEDEEQLHPILRVASLE